MMSTGPGMMRPGMASTGPGMMSTGPGIYSSSTQTTSVSLFRFILTISFQGWHQWVLLECAQACLQEWHLQVRV